MAYIWHQPRKRTPSSEPTISISQKFMSLNKACVDKYFKDAEYVKLGCDFDNKKLIVIPLEKGDTGGLKIIKNIHSVSEYINAQGAFERFNLTDAEKKVLPQYQGEYKCEWDSENKGIIINLKK
jgi:hypothetical protein